jgi:hypothetical protein
MHWTPGQHWDSDGARIDRDGRRGISRRTFVQRAGLLGVSAAGLGSLSPSAVASHARRPKLGRGPLRVARTNPRYLADQTGRLVYLAGAETWGNVQDGFISTAFGYNWGTPFQERAFLDMMSANGLNYIRLWLYETPFVTNFGGEAGQPDDHPHPVPWLRTGPGTAFDGGPKFDLTKIDPAYVARFRERAQAAGERGIYVSVMLFEGFSVLSPQAAQDLAGWAGHPFNATNNINGIDGDPGGTGQGIATHTLAIPAVTRLQDLYVRTIVNRMNDLDNVLYEIANESPGTVEWQYHVIDTIKALERCKLKRHPVFMSRVGRQPGALSPQNNDILFQSRADVIAPGNFAGLDLRSNPPEADGSKVIIAETDHMGFTALQDDPVGARAWAWKEFTRGNNPSLLDYDPDKSGFDEGVRALGDTRRMASRIDLVSMTPRSSLSSTGYCLADPSAEYLVYQPGSGAFTLNLRPGSYALEWLDPSAGATVARSHVAATRHTRSVEFTPPFAGDAVLHLKSRRRH